MAKRKKIAPYRATRVAVDHEYAIKEAVAALEESIRTLCQRFARKALDDALGIIDRK